MPLDLSDALPVDVYESVDVPVVVLDVVCVELCVPEDDMRDDLEPVGECEEVFETLLEPVVVGLISGVYELNDVAEPLAETVDVREGADERVWLGEAVGVFDCTEEAVKLLVLNGEIL